MTYHEKIHQYLVDKGISLKDIVGFPVMRSQTGEVCFYARPDWTKPRPDNGQPVCHKAFPVAYAKTKAQFLVGYAYSDGTVRQAEIVCAHDGSIEMPVWVLFFHDHTDPKVRCRWAALKNERKIVVQR